MIHTALKPFQCHKRVHAGKITHLEPATDACVVKIDGSAVGLAIPLAWYLKHQPRPGWYIVVYEDGYLSFSPPEPFERGYSPVDEPESADSTTDYSRH